MIALEQLTRAHFEPCIGQLFVCTTPTGPVPLTLAEAAQLGSERPGTDRAPFAVRFHGPAKLRLPQHIYRLDNEQLGGMEVFLVQTGADATTSHFEAIFN